MKAALPHRVYVGWQRYWEVEPWGPWRDNIHAGIITREIRAMRGGKSTIDTFMVRNPDERNEIGKKNLFTTLGTAATAVSPKEAARRFKKLRAGRRKRKS